MAIRVGISHPQLHHLKQGLLRQNPQTCPLRRNLVPQHVDTIVQPGTHIHAVRIEPHPFLQALLAPFNACSHSPVQCASLLPKSRPCLTELLESRRLHVRTTPCPPPRYSPSPARTPAALQLHSRTPALHRTTLMACGKCPRAAVYG